MFRIREVDPEDDDIADHIKDLHRLTFLDSAPIPEIEVCHWWLAYSEKTPVAFAGIQRSTHEPGAGYFNRVGVLADYRGHGLQRRLMRCLEVFAWKNGWDKIVSDTTPDNLPSANNFIACDYRLYQPKWPWSFDNALYWIKVL